MAPLMKSILHFLHPSSHHVHEMYRACYFICNGCRGMGYGARYRYIPCYFDLHECCATCRESLPQSHVHPEHGLEREVHEEDNINDNILLCDICKTQVLKLFYTCKHCDFDVHPLCSKLPCNVLHNEQPHLLKLLPKPVVGESLKGSDSCLECRKKCLFSCFHCAPCGTNLHLLCAFNLAIDAPPPLHFRKGCIPHLGSEGRSGSHGEQNKKDEKKETVLKRLEEVSLRIVPH
ncbi:hypothetical protein AMTRI_Chr08g161420 [Amborella trichopoda]|uniref:DC1 domain-containing protein n=1 Tax=Amborella trichopoda TaxID=13333 RepID=W1PJ77_AMBTC|nr:uncharacterized protein LOC18436298 [Amborella trichopoda]ERN08058.1 hypothetical protein AMTR_s00012p00263620 [Amborella trichopoda]|eukprot:XP_006846383.1 uncharacterized protein LOC18436298 [Amborella trichopoda]